MKKKICFITGSRAEYGLLKPLLDKCKKEPWVTLQIIVTGMHLSPEFGLTYREIEQGGFTIQKKVEILLSSDTPAATCKAMGLAQIGLADAYSELRPDVLVVLGDRFEIFSAVASAVICRIPVVHIHGGELTQGAFDDALRHSITKMSHLHFTATEEYRYRVIRMGEQPDSVFNVGAIGLDTIKTTKLFLGRKELEKDLKIKLWDRNLMVTFHPVTLEQNTARQQCQELLDALKRLNDTFVIFTKANADSGGRTINAMVDEYASQNQERCAVFASLGHLRYLSLLQYVDGVVGNSSSGIIEVPSFNIGTINIGDRQKGRIRSASVIDCLPVRIAITKSLKKLNSPAFKRICSAIENPYGNGTTSNSIIKILKSKLFRASIAVQKKFYDVSDKQ